MDVVQRSTEVRRRAAHAAPTGARPPAPNSGVGERLVVGTYVASQFIDRTLFEAGGLVVSVQKLAALLILPFGILMLRRIAVPPQLLVLAGLTGVAMGGAGLSSGQINDTLFAALVSVALNCLAAVVILSALLPPTGDLIRFFANTWVVCSILTAVLVVGQSLELIPLVGDAATSGEARETGSGLIRGTGLKYDPNFAAMVLVVGLVFCHHLWRGRLRWAGVVLLLVGTAATLSRMGTLVAVLVVVLTAAPRVSLLRSPVRKAAAVLTAAAGIAVAAFALFHASPPRVQLYLTLRMEDLGAAVQSLVFGVAPTQTTVNDGSGAVRADLNVAAWQVFLENSFVGVGANEVPAAIGRLTGAELPAHNTYLEILAMGGVFGLVVLLYYAAVVTLSLWRVPAGRGYGAPTDDRATVRAVRWAVLAMAVMATVLTVTYIAFFWLPMILALAARSAGRAGTAARAAAGPTRSRIPR